MIDENISFILPLLYPKTVSRLPKNGFRRWDLGFGFLLLNRAIVKSISGPAATFPVLRSTFPEKLAIGR